MNEDAKRRFSSYDHKEKSMISVHSLLGCEEKSTKRASISSDYSPLSDKMRPKSFSQFYGHEYLFKHSIFRDLRDGKTKITIPSILLYGCPGCGKTTLALLIAQNSPNYILRKISATTSGKSELLDAVSEAQKLGRKKKRLLLFVDEIHRWSKTQQDALLPHVENGTISIIGATTEHVSISLVPALVSRCLVVKMKRISSDGMGKIITRAGEMENLIIDPEAAAEIIRKSSGDARTALNILDWARHSALSSIGEGAVPHVTLKTVQEVSVDVTPQHDRSSSLHYDLLSALIKSIRGSDVDAAMYWLARLLIGGEDPKTISRRLIISASEDIGLADSFGLTLAAGCMTAAQTVGMPEVRIVLAHTVSYLSLAPKCTAAYSALARAEEAVHRLGALPVPSHLCNPVGILGSKAGDGIGYEHPQKYGGISAIQYLPTQLVEQGARFFVDSRLPHLK
ncbi:replication-associated recombination protein A [Aduncisulcus paluster]|uniref:Replication-associated recombination protein A n=1 Tax=Aduncisulcus paluster TaxID=2918883 RepID=A0ABQ5KKC5_9EUKA|nr:replication-associated recombination protein A [Aduncisulcus paluster]